MAKKKEITEELSREEQENSWRVVKVKVNGDRHYVKMERIVGNSVQTRDDSSTDAANPELYKAMATLGKLMVERIRQKDWIDDARLLGMSVDYSKDEHERMGMIATLYRPVNDMTGGLTVNTPRMLEKKEGASGGSFMSDDILNAVKTILRYAHDYIDGDRAQRDIVQGEAVSDQPALLN